MKCPIDHNELAHLTADMKTSADVHLDVCKVCQGVWVDADELKVLVSDFSSDYKKTYQEWLSGEGSGMTDPKDFWRESDRTCPKDGSTLKRHYLGVAQNIGIDQCPVCRGFWFDGAELYAVAKASEPNIHLDNALRGVVSGMYEELSDNYRDVNELWWNLPSQPNTALPFIVDLLFELIAAFIARK